MAVVEIIKFSTFRRAFQRNQLRSWLAAAPGVSDADEVLRQIVDLATAGNESALFDLPIEKLVGQIGAAAQVALTDVAYRDVVLALARGARLSDIELIYEEVAPEQSERAVRRNEARNRIVQRVQRSLDAVQISIGNLWARALQILSVAISILVIVLAVSLTKGWGAVTLPWLAVAVLGGMFAPIARDVVVAVQQLRKRAI